MGEDVVNEKLSRLPFQACFQKQWGGASARGILIHLAFTALIVIICRCMSLSLYQPVYSNLHCSKARFQLISSNNLRLASFHPCLFYCSCLILRARRMLGVIDSCLTSRLDSQLFVNCSNPDEPTTRRRLVDFSKQHVQSDRNAWSQTGFKSIELKRTQMVKPGP